MTGGKENALYGTTPNSLSVTEINGYRVRHSKRALTNYKSSTILSGTDTFKVKDMKQRPNDKESNCLKHSLSERN